ncbi:MAG: metal ABC transporter solute-binding protein, Zn/Mn family [Saccharofermentanales bacterium]
MVLFSRNSSIRIIAAMLLSLIFLLPAAGCAGLKVSPAAGKLLIGVTIVPQKAFVKAICGDLADVIELVPPGFSPESFDPDPLKMSRLSRTEIFFTLDLPSEQNMDFTMLEDTKIVDLADPVSEAYPDRFFSSGPDTQNETSVSESDSPGGDTHDHSGRDPHIWNSPRRAIIIVQAMADEISLLDPENSAIYAANATAYIADLQALDSELQQLFSGIAKKKIIVFHPAFGYFADDYGIEMYALEDNGREATASHLIDMIQLARDEGIRTIFTQKENGNRQPDTFADEIGGIKVVLDPLSEDYIGNTRSMASKIAEALGE